MNHLLSRLRNSKLCALWHHDKYNGILLTEEETSHGCSRIKIHSLTFTQIQTTATKYESLQRRRETIHRAICSGRLTTACSNSSLSFCSDSPDTPDTISVAATFNIGSSSSWKKQGTFYDTSRGQKCWLPLRTNIFQYDIFHTYKLHTQD